MVELLDRKLKKFQVVLAGELINIDRIIRQRKLHLKRNKR